MTWGMILVFCIIHLQIFSVAKKSIFHCDLGSSKAGFDIQTQHTLWKYLLYFVGFFPIYYRGNRRFHYTRVNTETKQLIFIKIYPPFKKKSNKFNNKLTYRENQENFAAFWLSKLKNSKPNNSNGLILGPFELEH